MRRLLIAALSAFAVSVTAFASNIPLITGPIDPSSLVGTLNQSVIQATNFGVSGLLGSLATPATSSGTSKIALFNVTVPASQLNIVGQTMHMKAVGVNSADTNAKTLTFDFGAISCALTMTGSGNSWEADFWVTATGTATEQYSCAGRTGTSALAVVQNSGTVSLTGAVAADISATAATSGTMTLNQGWMDQIK